MVKIVVKFWGDWCGFCEGLFRFGFVCGCGFVGGFCVWEGENWLCDGDGCVWVMVVWWIW